MFISASMPIAIPTSACSTVVEQMAFVSSPIGVPLRSLPSTPTSCHTSPMACLGRPLMPRVIAHRGARSVAPENTIPAIAAAKNMGATFCEVDVMLSKDGVAFIHHDKELERCSNGKGFFSNMDSAEIELLDAGSWFHPSFAGTRIPKLIDLIKACKEYSLGLNLEIKHLRKNADDEPTEEQSAAERETAEETCRILKELGPEAGKVLISSFSVEALEVCQAQLPSIPRSLLVEAVPQDWYEQVKRLRCVSLNFNSKKVTQMTVEEIASTGTPMYSYTVNDGDRAIELLSWGVDGVFSDCPDVIEEAIRRAALPSLSPGAT